ncbi:MAG: hypothetical protein ACLP5H_24100, partial [Desulfomonilaceae bacterium]
SSGSEPPSANFQKTCPQKPQATKDCSQWLFIQSSQSLNGHYWWWVYDDTYIVTMGAIEGYHIVRWESFLSWLPPHKAGIFVLRKTDPVGGP